MNDFYNKYPYTDFHELNLDYVLEQIKQLTGAMEVFTAGNKLNFADPILWNITAQYPKNTIVLDSMGNAYLSLDIISAGIPISNNDYWMEIFNFTGFLTAIDSNITFNMEFNTEKATNPYNTDDWLLINNLLYKVTAPIPVDDLFVEGSNIVRFSLEQFIKAWIVSCQQLIQQYKNDIDTSELQYKNELSAEMVLLNSRLDAAIAGVTVDSEVIDARVGYDSTTYATLGDAIRTQVSNLHNIADPLKDVTDVALLMTSMSIIKEGYRINYSTGATTAAAGFDVIYCTRVRPGMKLIYNSVQSYGPVLGLAFYTENGTYVSGVSSYNAAYGLIEVPATAYQVAATINHGNYNELLYVPEAFHTMLQAKLEPGDFEIYPLDFIYGNQFIDRTGTLQAFTGFEATDYIDITGYDVIRFSGTSHAQAACIIFYDAAKQIVDIFPPVAGHNDYIDQVYVRPSNVVYARMNDLSAYDASWRPARLIGNTDISVPEWKDKRWIVFGDSLSLSAPNGVTNAGYFDYIRNKTGISLYNMGGDGTGYKNYPGLTFRERALNIPTGYDVVTIFGSGNDCGKGYTLGTPMDSSTDTLCGCINLTIDNIYATDPDIKLGLITPTPWQGYPPMTADNEMEQYSDAIVAIARRRGIPVLDLYHCSGLRPWDAGYRADYFDTIGVHPNAKGHKIIATHVKAFLESILI